MAATAKRTVLTFVTGNKKKLEELLAILPDGFAFNVVNHKVDLPELQGEPNEVSAEKCKLAAEAVGGPVFVEDTSLCFNALGGMPGVYIKWFLKHCGHDGLNKMIGSYEDKSGYAQCVFSFSPHPKATPVTFVGRCHGSIVPARGPTDFGWDPVFQPDGYEETYAEMDKEIKNTISHRARAVQKLLKYLVDNQEAVEKAIRDGSEAPPADASALTDDKDEKK